MNEYANFIKRIGVVGIANILISLSGLIFIPIITKSFSTADYGVWAQVNTFVSLIPNFVNLGLPYTMVRFLSAEKDPAVIKQSFYSMMLLVLASTLIMSFVFLIFSNQIATALFDGSMQIMYIVIAMSFSYFRPFLRVLLRICCNGYSNCSGIGNHYKIQEFERGIEIRYSDSTE